MELKPEWRLPIDDQAIIRGAKPDQTLARGARKGGQKKQAARVIRETVAPALNWTAPKRNR